MIYCIDTNSVLDFCYRYYPQALFEPVWVAVSQAIRQNHIKLVISEHVHVEILQKIAFKKLDRNTIETFIHLMQIDIIKQADYQENLIQLSNQIKAITTKIKDSTIDKNDGDLSNICVCLSQSAFLITAEQGQGKSLSDPNYNRLKLPDVCHHFQVPCDGWIALFRQINLSL